MSWAEASAGGSAEQRADERREKRGASWSVDLSSDVEERVPETLRSAHDVSVTGPSAPMTIDARSSPLSCALSHEARCGTSARPTRRPLPRASPAQASVAASCSAQRFDCAASRASTMTRTTGSVPDGRISTRPLRRARGRPRRADRRAPGSPSSRRPA